VTTLTSLLGRLDRSRAADVLYPGLAALLILGVWEAVTRGGLVPHYLLPSPTAIFVRSIAVADTLMYHAWITSVEITLGFLLAVVLGVTFALGIVSVRAIERALYPWLVVVQVVPKVAIGPLLVVWLGFGLAPKVIIAFLIAFFPIMIDTMVGLRSVRRESLFLLRSMGATRWQVFLRLQLPNALPYMFAGMKVGITLAVVGAIVGEFIGADSGLGYILIFANGLLDTTLMFVALIWISVQALLFYVVVVALERYFVGWHVSHRMKSVLSS
jgi:NitT/TauT family transport system permease protein